MVIGLFSPWKFNKETFDSYDITKLRNYVRFIKILEQRRGKGQNVRCPILFDAAVGDCSELPKSDDTERMKQTYEYIKRIDNEKISYLNETVKKMSFLTFVKRKLNG